MSAETLHTAARRVVRFFRIDEAHGGLTSRETLMAMDTLSLHVDKETARLKAIATAIEDAENAGKPDVEVTFPPIGPS